MDFLITSDYKILKFFMEMFAVLTVGVLVILLLIVSDWTCRGYKTFINSNPPIKSKWKISLNRVINCFLLLLIPIFLLGHFTVKKAIEEQARISYHLLRHMVITADVATKMNNEFGCYPTSVNSMLNKDVFNSSYGNTCDRDNVIGEKLDVFANYSAKHQEFDIPNFNIKPFSVDGEIKTNKSIVSYVVTGLPENLTDIIYDVCLKSHLNLNISGIDFLLGREKKYNFLLTKKDRNLLNQYKKCGVLNNGDFAYYIG